MDAASAETEAHQGATAMLDAILARAEADAAVPPEVGLTNEDRTAEMTLGALVDQMEERAFGVMLLMLALPCCLPFVYGLPQIVAFPMLLIAGQMALGRHTPWLPKSVRERRFAISSMRNVVDRARKYLGWFEALSRPRAAFLTGPAGSRIVGPLLLIPCASILVPLPLTNTTPGIGVAVASIGVIERDGLLVLGGLFIGLVWVAVLILGGQAAIEALKAMVTGAF